ncbi:polysaccharide biosynthesis protein [Paenibacillus filicis]|uniref:Polysaccharide biosynthesis protein n=1 Tax=Paenibacillus gyeongsangnamensis TaxID=3388067 RepID=A0ABT4QLA9_9BACL|nr:polysaccharide biosynthesis protein [Paenibacillus filicis]MCZ8517491.1 polysaccharide biosynthesis protein [Paenibacillus filicis]
MSKDSLVKGTLILTIAALVARALGVVQRVPLVYLLQEKGMAWYGLSFNLYSVLLVVATAGVPSALSKMISERTALGRIAEAERVYSAAALFSLGAGIVMTAFLYALAPFSARIAGLPEATGAIRALAPALLLFPLIAIMRGYFQGRQNMLPNGLSQIIEQIFRVAASVLFAYLLLGRGLEWAAAGASFGGVAGSIAAVAVMLFYARKLRRSEAQRTLAEPGSEVLTYRTIYRQLFGLSIPIVIFSVTVTLIYTIDSMLVTPLLQGTVGRDQATELLGILSGRAQSLAGIPIILAVALSQSIVPIISAAYSKKDLPQVAGQTSRVLQLAILSGLPAVLVICVAARPINGFIFGNTTGSAVVDAHAAPIIIALTVSAIFQIVMQTSGAVLMGMGRMRILVWAVVVGIAVKLIGSYALAPLFGIYGIIGATALCFVVMTALNVYTLKKEVSFRILRFSRWTGLALTTIVIAALGFGLDRLCSTYVHPFGTLRWDDMVQSVIQCAVAAAAYPLLLLLTRTLTLSDLESLPGPLRRLAGPVLRRLGRSAQAQ